MNIRDYKNLGLDVGVLFGDRKEYDKTHTICTWQSLSIMEKKSKKYEADFPIDTFLEDVVCIMVDEVHKAKADVLRNLLSGAFRNVPVRWGLTGTIPKDEYEAVGCVCSLGPVIGNLSSKELQDKGVLAKLDINILQMQDGVLGFNNYAQELKWLVTDKDRITEISKVITGLSTNGNTLVLIDRIATGYPQHDPRRYPLRFYTSLNDTPPFYWHHHQPTHHPHWPPSIASQSLEEQNNALKRHQEVSCQAPTHALACYARVRACECMVWE